MIGKQLDCLALNQNYCGFVFMISCVQFLANVLKSRRIPFYSLVSDTSREQLHRLSDIAFNNSRYRVRIKSVDICVLLDNLKVLYRIL